MSPEPNLFEIDPSTKGDSEMEMSPLQNIYVTLGETDRRMMDAVCAVLSGLLPYGNLTVNLYLIAEGIGDGMPQVEQIQRVVGHYLKANRLARVYIHFVHSLYVGTPKDVDYYYQYYYQSWKRSSWGFDREGFVHQEVPRLMLLPVIVPEEGTDPGELAKLLALLKGAFFLPGLCVDQNTTGLIEEEGITKLTEKIYTAVEGDRDLSGMVRTLYSAAIVEDLSANLESGVDSIDGPCPLAMIVSAREGKVYGCLESFTRDLPLIAYLQNPDPDTLMLRYNETLRDRPCMVCKEARVKALAGSGLDGRKAREAGALFFRFGASHQEVGDFSRAVKSFTDSLTLSDQEEFPTIHFRIGLCRMNMGAYEKALAAFETCECDYRNQHYFHFYTGLCHYEAGRLVEAVQRLSKAVELNPPSEDLARILIYLGTCYNGLNRYEDAVDVLEKAKRLTDRKSVV